MNAQANREFMTALNQREAANQGHFGSLGNPAQSPPSADPAATT